MRRLVLLAALLFAISPHARAGASSSACSLYIDGSVAVDIVTQNVAVKLGSTTTGVNQGSHCTAAGTATDTITLNAAGMWLLSLGVSNVSVGGGTQDYEWAIFAGGSKIAQCSFDHAANSSNKQRGAVTCLYSAAPGAILDVRVANESRTQDATVSHMGFTSILVN